MSLETSVRRLAEGLPEAERPRVEEAAGRLAAFLEFLIEKNRTTNLVSASSSDPAVLVETHLHDSLLGLPLLPGSGCRRIRLLDVGSGGGFPAIPLLLTRSDLDGTLVESSGRKAAYLGEALERLALTARVVNARFPDSFPMAGTPLFDVLTTRAVGSAGKLVRAARPILSASARALLWTSEPLSSPAARSSRAARASFHLAPGAERRGILSLECFT